MGLESSWRKSRQGKSQGQTQANHCVIKSLEDVSDLSGSQQCADSSRSLGWLLEAIYGKCRETEFLEEDIDSQGQRSHRKATLAFVWETNCSCSSAGSEGCFFVADSNVYGVEFFLLCMLEFMRKSPFWLWASVIWQGKSRPWAVHTEWERGLGVREISILILARLLELLGRRALFLQK